MVLVFRGGAPRVISLKTLHPWGLLHHPTRDVKLKVGPRGARCRHVPLRTKTFRVKFTHADSPRLTQAHLCSSENHASSGRHYPKPGAG
jgi:hypothetical protein